eukprot:5253324-Prymnesium_polylepis.1
MTSSSNASYRELYQLVKNNVDRIGMFGVAGNPAQAPKEPQEPGDKARNMIVNHTMLSHFGDVEDRSARKFVRMDRLNRPDVLRKYRRAFLLMLKDSYQAAPIVLPESMVNARECWLVGDPESRGISKSDSKPVEEQCEPCPAAAAPHADSEAEIVSWIAAHLRPSAAAFVRLVDLCDRIEKDASIVAKYCEGKTGKAARQEIWTHVRMRTEAALGAGHVWVIGKTANKTIYYNANTVIGKAHGGIKVPGWHLPGFELVSSTPSQHADDDEDGDDDLEYDDGA